MAAIYKREVRSYLTSVLGYVFIAVNLLMVGIYFTNYNLNYGYPYMDYTLSGVCFIFLITTPILTMKTMAEERRQKTDQLLLTSPVTPARIVLGKYLALVTIFLIPMVILAFYPLILTMFGSVPLRADYTALFGYFLLGCTYLAVGLFISSLTESPVLAAVLTFGVSFLCYMSSAVGDFISGTAFATYISVLVLILLLCLILYAMTKSRIVTAGAFVVLAAALTVCYFADSSLLSGGIQKVIGIFDFSEPFYTFLDGIFDISSVLYYLSVIGICCFFAVQSIEKRRWGYHHGSYSVGWTAAVLAIVIVVNLTAAELPAGWTSIDMTENQYYTLSDQSREVLNGLTEDVTIYMLTEDGTSDGMTESLLEQYESSSSHIHVEERDLVQYPTFASNYTTETLSAGSLIVEMGDRSRVIPYSDLYEYSYSYYSSYASAFDGEGQITSAISYVSSEDIPKLYALEGHRESELSDTLTDQIEKENLEVESLNLVSAGSVPEDAAAVIIHSPQTDLSQEEAQMLLEYLQNGGNAFITSLYTGEEMPNFNSVLEYYGVTVMDGIVIEGDSDHYYPQNQIYLLPEIQSTSLTSSLVSDNRLVLMPISQAVESLGSVRDTVEITSLLQTSDSSYNKADALNMTTAEKEDGDAEGPFDVGVLITETVEGADGETDTSGEEAAEDENETRIVYFGSGYLLEEQMDSAVSGGNYELVMNCLSSLADHETTVAIPAKSLEVTYLTLTAANVNMFSILLTAALPVAFLAAGGVIWYRRRRR